MDNSNQDPASVARKAFASIDFNFNYISSKALSVLKNPKGIWPTLKHDGESIGEIYKRYLVFMAAIPAICGFIGMAFIGVSDPFGGVTRRWGFLDALASSIVTYVLSLVSVFVFACVLEFLAPRFGGKSDRTNAFKLIVYSLTPVYIAGLLSLVPSLSVLSILFVVWAIYLLLCGIVTMTEVPEEEKIKFVAVAVISWIILGLIVSVLGYAVATPTPPAPLA